MADRIKESEQNGVKTWVNSQVDFKTSDVPVTNPRNFFKSSTDRVVMKVFSIWYTQSSLPSLSDES